jgi:hypothetical protein
MASHPPPLRGIIHGKTIELEREPGLPDGQEVTVTMQLMISQSERLPPGEGIRRSAGGWADEEGLDEYLEQARQQRRMDRRDIEP